MTEPIEFDASLIAKMIEQTKATNNYESKGIEQKLQLRAAVELEFADKLMQIVGRCFPDLPAYDPMFQGQQIQAILERLYPDCVDSMQLRWLPYLLSPETYPYFPPFIESAKYIRLRETAYRLLNEPNSTMKPEERAHLAEISEGRMPPGVFSSHHSAWLICDALKENEPINADPVANFLAEQKLPSGTKPKSAEQVRAELNV